MASEINLYNQLKQRVSASQSNLNPITTHHNFRLNSNSSHSPENLDGYLERYHQQQKQNRQKSSYKTYLQAIESKPTNLTIKNNIETLQVRKLSGTSHVTSNDRKSKISVSSKSPAERTQNI